MRGAPPFKFALSFDYELVLNPNVTDITSAVESLEDAILQDLASQFLKCDLSGRRAMSTMNARYLQDVDDNAGIVQLESTPADIPDAGQGMLFLLLLLLLMLLL